MCVVSASGRLLTFEIDELKVQPKGGRGLLLIGLERGDTLVGAAAYARSVRIDGVARSGQPRAEVLEARSLHNALAARGRKGRDVRFGFKPQRVLRVL